MNRMLTQDELDELIGGRAMGAGGGHAAVYNFRRPDRIGKDQIRSMHFLHDRFARNISTSLSAYLRTTTEVNVVSVEQFSYSEFLMSLPDPTAFYALSMAPLDGLAALEINPAVAFPMIDRMLGGTGQRTGVTRGLTEIEQNVVDGVVKVVLENLTETWSHIAEVRFRISGRETRPQMLQVAMPNETVILLIFDIRLGDARGMLNLCIPASIIETFGASFAQAARARRKPNAEERAAVAANLARIRMPLTVTIESRLPASELVPLAAGDVLSLGVPIDTPLVVRMGGVPKFTARAVRVGDNAGVTLAGAVTGAAHRNGAVL
jgi:flagellar motor switch protein FliM